MRMAGSAFMGKGRELSSLAKAGHDGRRGGSIEIYSRRVLKRICAFGERDFALRPRPEQSPSASPAAPLLQQIGEF
jgi:hypothetical protein